ncbi:PREDICTED: TOX high mobility group box family member 4-like isoform X3 [Priapulus caudatus]|uniref:TOX high mobility group box family member 4-like isoform X3 n=1 Tax=Priapulus caudatus TaxID=37621 RepID=A0ABM1DPR9_PRICU|nr:PREDICTED: TOX high mobility group box family member 4-like isoform X3 [Priapulus caudatus]
MVMKQDVLASADRDFSNMVNQYLVQTFHAPTLADDDFDIPVIAGEQSGAATTTGDGMLNHVANVPYSDFSGGGGGGGGCPILADAHTLDFNINPQFPTQNLDNIPQILDEVFTEIVQLDAPFMTTTTPSRPQQPQSHQMAAFSASTAPSVGQQQAMFMLTTQSVGGGYRTVAGNARQQPMSQRFPQPGLVQQTVMTTASGQMMSPPPRGAGQSQGLSPNQQQTSSPLGHSAATLKSPSQSSSSSPTSESSDDSLPLSQLSKRAPPSKVIKKQKSPKKKKKRDPNEPQKPVSAYALFFRDTQAAIKSQNPQASFGEVSKIVASMWDSLDEEHKNVYKKKTETAKKEYLKQLAAYRANLVSQGLLGGPTQLSEHKKVLTQSVTSSLSPTTMSPPQQLSPMMDTYSPEGPCMTPNTLGAQFDVRKIRCIRNGCTNFAVDSPDWDREYCSNEDVFMAWVASRQQQPSVLYT